MLVVIALFRLFCVYLGDFAFVTILLHPTSSKAVTSRKHHKFTQRDSRAVGRNYIWGGVQYGGVHGRTNEWTKAISGVGKIFALK